jgi:hypothetical protein
MAKWKAETPKFGLWWVLWVHVCLWFVCAPKLFQLCTNNLLFGLYKSMWIIELLVIHLNPYPGAPACPSTLEELLAKERIPTFYPSVVFTFGFVIKSTKGFGGASQLGYLLTRLPHIYLFMSFLPTYQNMFYLHTYIFTYLRCMHIVMAPFT